MQQLRRAWFVSLGAVATLALSSGAAFAQASDHTSPPTSRTPSSTSPTRSPQTTPTPPNPPPGYASPHTTVRRGLMWGIGVGGGSIRCDGPSCGGTMAAGSIDAHIGDMLRPRLALMFDLWVMAHTENQLTLTHTLATAAVQFWLFPRIWLKGGVGAAHATFDYHGALVTLRNRSASVLGIMGAVGFEAIASRSFVLDVALKGGTGFYSNQDTQAHNVALEAGFNWY